MFSHWCRKLFGTPAQPARKVRRAARRPLAFESLEDRTVPSFLAANSFVAGANPAGMAVADYSGDGRGDIVVVDTANSVGILISNGDGSFQPRVGYATGTVGLDVAAGDFNADGKIDLAVVGTNVTVLLGNGDGTFGTPTVAGAGVNAHSTKVGDFNNDGKADIATMNYGSATVLLGNGDGTFQPRRDTVVAGNSINAVTGDFNKDGNLDLATSDTTSVGTVNVLLGHGDGTFAAAANYYAFSAPVYLAVGDFNEDGYDDFACPNSYAASAMTVLINNGNGTYGGPHTYGIGQTGYEIEVDDFNGDGHDDYAVRGGSSYMVHLGKGDGTFYSEVTYPTPAGRFEAGTHGDFNGDGAVDFAYPSPAGVTVVMNAHDDAANLAGAVGFSVSAPPSTTAGSALPLTVSAVDATGAVATGFRGTVYLSSSDAAANSAVAYTFTAADAGTHAFGGSVRLVTAGPQTVTAAAPFLASASVSVTVTPAVTHYGVTAPATLGAGGVAGITVSALDALNNVGTGYGNTVHFTSSDAQAGLPADYTFTAADAGVHTFSVVLKSAGLRYVGGVEAGGSISGGANITVTPGAASKFVLAGGAGAVGVARPLAVTAADDFGNTASGYTGTVHFTSSDPLATLPADTALVNGTATANVTFRTVGTQTVTATDVATPALTGTVSSDATPPVAALFQVTGLTATTAGVAKSFTVSVRDTIGQTATGYTGTVVFSSSDVQAGLPASYTFTAADAGAHSFTATLKTAGTQSVTVTDSTGPLTGTQMGVAVSAATFTGYKLNVPNLGDSKGHILVTAGEAISLTVKAVDAYGNVVAGYRGKAKFTSTDALAGLPANYSFTAADAGAHTFAVDLRTATPNGVVWSFNVVDAANAATLATITNFEVMNAAASKFTLAVPSNITAGAPFALKVTVLDAYGNKVKNYFGTVHFGNTAGVAGLPADYAFTGDDAGVHTYTVTLTTTGNQTISATDLANGSLFGTAAVSVKTGGGGGGGGGGGSGGGRA